QGPPAAVAAVPEALTGRHLGGAAGRPTRAGRRPGGAELVVRGARAHNLAGVTARFPLGLLVAVSGPSGSGKSSLLLDILAPAARPRFAGASQEIGRASCRDTE